MSYLSFFKIWAVAHWFFPSSQLYQKLIALDAYSPCSVTYRCHVHFHFSIALLVL